MIVKTVIEEIGNEKEFDEVNKHILIKKIGRKKLIVVRKALYKIF